MRSNPFLKSWIYFLSIFKSIKPWCDSRYTKCFCNRKKSLGNSVSGKITESNFRYDTGF